MAGKDNLRKQRTGTVINNTSEKREGKVAVALNKVTLYLINKFSIKLEHESNAIVKFRRHKTIHPEQLVKVALFLVSQDVRYHT